MYTANEKYCFRKKPGAPDRLRGGDTICLVDIIQQGGPQIFLEIRKQLAGHFTDDQIVEALRDWVSLGVLQMQCDRFSFLEQDPPAEGPCLSSKETKGSNLYSGLY